MTPKGKRYESAYAYELLRIARGDLDSARALSPVGPGRPENICYLAQQCVEKCLKAVICHLNMPVTHTHDVEALLNLLPEEHRPPNPQELFPLTEYATIRRYEEGYEILEPNDIRSIIDLGERILVWAEKKCGNDKANSKTPSGK